MSDSERVFPWRSSEVVLKATPASLSSSSSFGEQLQTAAKDGMLDTIKSLTNEALSRGVGLATSAAVAWANSQG